MNELAEAHLDSVIEICLDIKNMEDQLKKKRKFLASLIRDNRDLFKEL